MSTNNVLLHGSDKVFKPNSDPISPTTTSTGNTITAAANASKGIVQIAEIEVSAGGKSCKALAFCDTGSTDSWIGPSLKKELSLGGKDQKVLLTSFSGTQETDSEMFEIMVQGECSTAPFILKMFLKPAFKIGNDIIDVKMMKERFKHLKPVSSGVLD